MEFVVYCDESRHDHCGQNPYMAIGSLWLPRSLKPELTRGLRTLRESVGLRGEVKWSKVSGKKLDAYKRIVDFFFDKDDIHFRVIVVEQGKVDVQKCHGGDRELGFYKFYFELLEKWLRPQARYLVLLDFKKNRGADRYTTLRRVLENTTKGRAWIDELTVIDSHESALAQLSDLLTGATAAKWCGLQPETAKGKLVRYIGERRGCTLTVPDTTAVWNKFNVFAIKLEPQP